PRRERRRPAGAGRAGEFQRQRGRGAGVDDRDPARLRDQRQGDLHHRPDARLPEPEPVMAMNLFSFPSFPRTRESRDVAVRRVRTMGSRVRGNDVIAALCLLTLTGCASVMGDVRPFEPYAPVAAYPGTDPATAT